MADDQMSVLDAAQVHHRNLDVQIGQLGYFAAVESRHPDGLASDPGPPPHRVPPRGGGGGGPPPPPPGGGLREVPAPPPEPPALRQLARPPANVRHFPARARTAKWGKKARGEKKRKKERRVF